MKQNSKFQIHFGWLLAGIAASIVVLVSIFSGSIYDWLDFRMIDRATEPVWYWFLFVGHIIIAVGGFRVALTWGNPQFRQAYEDQKLRDRKYSESQLQVSGRKMIIVLIILVFIFLVATVAFRSP